MNQNLRTEHNIILGGDFVLFKKDDYVQYKKYIGIIHFVMEENKTYIVTLLNYHGMKQVDRQIDQRELCEFTQIALVHL